jgi:peroxiredoxin
MKVKRMAVAVVAAAVVGLGAYFALPLLLTPERAPTVSYTLLNANAPTTAQWQGKVTLVNFWATSCVTCVKEMPELVATHQKFKARGFDTLAVAMAYDNPSYVQRFTEQRQLPFAVTIDSQGELARQFGDVQLTPTTVLINKRGEIVKRYVGEPDFQALHALLEKLLSES